MKQQKLLIRAISFVLVALMMVAVVQVGVFAEQLPETEFDKNEFYTIDNIPNSLKTEISDKLANARGLDCSNAEVLNSLTLINNDNTKTLFSYEEAIKYIDSDGYIRFIDNSLKSVVKAENIFEWYTFENTAGNVKQYFPVSVATGIRIESEGYTVRLIPHTLLNTAATRAHDDNTVNYVDAFGTGIMLQYISQHNGVKENIILDNYNNQNVFEYTVKVKDLVPELKNDGSIVFTNDQGEIVFNIKKPFAYDSAEVPNYCNDVEYSISALENGDYLFTMTVDSAYLSNDNTVYPVTVDPTIVSDTLTDVMQFESTTFYSDGSKLNSDTFQVGVASNGIKAITFMKIADMTSFIHINPEQISSARLMLRPKSSNTENFSMELKAIPNDGEVDAANLNWNDITSKIQTNGLVYMSESDDTIYGNFDTKDLFKNILSAETKYYARETNVYSKSGFYLNSDDSMHTFYSSACSDNLQRPIMYIVYKDDVSLEPGYYYIQSGYYYETAPYLTDSGLSNPTIYGFNGELNQIWEVRRTVGDFSANLNYTYRIRNVATGKYIAGSGLRSAMSDEDLYFDASFTVKIPTQTNLYKRIMLGEYDYKKTLAVKYYSKTDGSVVVPETVNGLDSQRWRFRKVDPQITVKNNTINMVEGEKKFTDYTAVPESIEPTWSTSNDSVATVDDMGIITAIGIGTATVTGTITYTDSDGSNKYKSTQIIVNVDPQHLSFYDNDAVVNIGKSIYLAKNTNLPNGRYTWSSSNTDVIEVNSIGRITGKSIGSSIITVTEENTGKTAQCTVYCDRYYYSLIKEYEFEPYTAYLIRDLNNRADSVYPNLSQKQRDERIARTLTSVCYDGTIWKLTCNIIQNRTEVINELTNVFGYTNQQAETLYEDISEQHRKGKRDFAHFQAVMLGRLVYINNSSNALITENLSYETGWLGDATLYEADLTTHFGNEDYCADLDGENVFRLISSGKSMADAINEYNAYLDNGGNRADKFLSYIGFDEVKSAVFNTLVIIPLNTEIEALTQANQDGSKTDQIILLNMLILDEQYHWSVVKTKYHDTYLFLRSLEGRLSEIDVNAQ